ncbi:MAG: CRISPR-associated endonuclease Cas1 [Chloroflexaceae bacterium]|nr:CRISPR-associated endonuclease Cas1 [Chloroflexaceae bacterium]
MATLYVQEQGVTVRKRDEQVLITCEGKILQEIPLNKIDQVVLMGRGVQMSTALLVELTGRGIPVMLTNQRGSRHYATLVAIPSRKGHVCDGVRFYAEATRLASGALWPLCQASGCELY